MKTFTKTLVGFAAAGALTLATQANAQIYDFVYDTTAGATSTYTGDSTAGTLTIDHIAGRNFRVQRIPQGPGNAIVADGFFGTGTAALSASMDLTSTFDFNGDGPGPGDKAIFAGAQTGSDFIAYDEFGESWGGNIEVFELIDDTDSIVRPGIVGQGIITDITFSGATFQGITTDDLFDFGTVLTFTFVIEQAPGDILNLLEYLDNPAFHVPIEIETIEARISGIPLPATTGLAFAGLLPFCAVSMRRRR